MTSLAPVELLLVRQRDDFPRGGIKANDASGAMAFQQIAKLPLTYLQLGDGLDTPEGIALIKGIPTLRRLTITNAKPLTDADLKLVASITQLEHLELSGIPLPEERLALLKGFTFLKSMRLVPSGAPFTPETQAKVKQLLPKTELQLK